MLDSATEQQRTWLDKLGYGVRREASLQRSACEKIWNMPLHKRVDRGYSLGPLKVVSATRERVLLQPSSLAAEMADCMLREGSFVCLSCDQPFAPHGRFIHAGEDDAGIHLLRWSGDLPAAGSDGWVMDPDFYDMSPRFLEAIDALAASALGCARILPLLMGDHEATLDAIVHDEVMDDLENADAQWHDSQHVAIAACVAAHDAHLVQGPPGTGKTRVLAEVVRRLVDSGQRVLVTGPTHRAINHALAEVCAVVPDSCRVIKVGFHVPTGRAVYEECDDYASSGLLAAAVPHVVGATPHALWGKTSGLREAHFDTVLLDEASQLTPILAAMAMLRGERWLFFGDDCQLPPVVIGDDGIPARLRSVFGRLKNRGFDTMLEQTWRLNQPLAEWPSATFYANRLSCRHDQRLQLGRRVDHPALRPDPAACLLRCATGGSATVRSDEEAQVVADLVRQAVAGGLPPERIGVITPFRAQAARIRQVLGIADGGLNLRGRVVVDTVERYQGQERDVVVVSLAAGNEAFIRLRADFLFQAERWNVTMTRARLKTVVVVSAALLDSARALADEGHAGATCFASLVKHLEAPPDI